MKYSPILDHVGLAQDIQSLEKAILASLGEQDVVYIRRIQRLVFVLEVLGRGLLFLGFFPPAWIAGVLLLSVSKIIENTELGHNLMHGQYDWTNDPALRGSHYEFDVVATADNWRQGHNLHHHTNTGIEGLDNDIGLLRFSRRQAWRWYHCLQVPLAMMFALLSQWGVAVQDMRLGELVSGKLSREQFWQQRLRPVISKSARQLLKDYVIFPLLAGPYFLSVMLGNLLANALRNVWVWLVIACGHCVGGVKLYRPDDIRAQPATHWYVRQITSSANFSSGPMLSVLTGHLGYHIEHHLYPALPACRYPQIARELKAICRRHGLPYNERPFLIRAAELAWRLARFSFPATGIAARSEYAGAGRNIHQGNGD